VLLADAAFCGRATDWYALWACLFCGSIGSFECSFLGSTRGLRQLVSS